MSDELKPCPFCGDKAETGSNGNSVFIRCSNGFCGMSSIYSPSWDWDSCKKGWNNRHDSWFSVHDELPNNETAVLCHDKEGSVSEMYFYKGKFHFPRDYSDLNDYDFEFLKNISHWMYMPKAEVKNEQ